MSPGKRSLTLFAAALLWGAVAAFAADAPRMQKVALDGVSVEFLPNAGSAPGVDAMEGENVDLRFWIRGADGARLAGIRPAAWIDLRNEKEDGACGKKVQSFLSGSLRARPQVDLNSYFVVVLTSEPVLLVIDPILGFGGSRLFTAVNLRGKGSDWVLTRDHKRLFVAMPQVNQVAVVDTDSWKVVADIAVGMRPSQVVLGADETLWVAGENDVTVLDTRSLTVKGSLRIGRGAHRIALTSGVAAVTNGAEGSVTLVDAATLRVLGEVKTAPSPVTIASSALSGAIYAGHADGTIAVIDPDKRQVTARIAAKAGLTSIRFTPDGRFGFVTVPSADVVQVIDSSSSSLVATIAVPSKPDQIAFTDTNAHVRSAGSDHVTMIRLSDLAAGRAPHLTDFPAGQIPPSAAKADSVAGAITPAPQAGAVFVANPGDRLIYFYEEGMAAPMGSYKSYGRTPLATVIVDRSLRETEPGVFSIRTRVPAAGMYDVVFFLDSPRVVHCFSMAVRSNPELKKRIAERAVTVEPALATSAIRVGQPVELTFKLTNPDTGKPHEGLEDVRILTFLAPGIWQKRAFARAGGEGKYSITAVLPKAGVYYAFVECPSLGLRLNASRPVIFQAEEAQ